MGQSPLSGGQDLSASEPDGSDMRPTEFAGDYLSKFVGSSPRSRGSQDRSAHSRKLEERSKSDLANNCCSLPIVSFSELTNRSFINASSGKTIGTDMNSLLDVNGDGVVQCGEVWRAICMVNPEQAENGGVSTQEGVGYLDVQHQRDDAEVQVPSQLQVPTQFQGISYDWTAESASQSSPSPKEQERLENCMKPFIQSMLLGVLVRLRLEAGEAPDGDPLRIDATITLNQDFSVLTISAGSAQRPIPIKVIRLVRPPDNCSDSDKCADLRLAAGRFVRFNFDSQDQAKFFGTCMRLLVKAARSSEAAQTTRSA